MDFGSSETAFLELRRGAGQVGFFQKSNSQPVVCLRGRWPDLHGVLEGFQCMRIVVPIPIRQAERDMKLEDC